MTTIREIVDEAYRENGIIQIGTSAEAEQLDEGVRKLQRIILGLLGNEVGTEFESVAYGASFDGRDATDYDTQSDISNAYFPANTRLLLNLSGPDTIYLHPSPKDGDRISIVDVAGSLGTGSLTLKGNGRKIDGETSVVLNTANDSVMWMYRQDIGSWTRVSPLTANSDSPFPEEFDPLLETYLSMRLNPRYQTQTAPETLMEFKKLRSRFRSRYNHSRKMYPDVPYTTSDWGAPFTGNYWRPLNSDVHFDRGLI